MPAHGHSPATEPDQAAAGGVQVLQLRRLPTANPQPGGPRRWTWPKRSRSPFSSKPGGGSCPRLRHRAGRGEHLHAGGRETHPAIRRRLQDAGDHRRLRPFRRNPGPAKLGRRRRVHPLRLRETGIHRGAGHLHADRRPRVCGFRARGCPINAADLLELVSALLAGKTEHPRTHSVCIECKRKGWPCVLVAQGKPCLGPITQVGSGPAPATTGPATVASVPWNSPTSTSLGRWFTGKLGQTPRDMKRMFAQLQRLLGTIQTFPCNRNCRTANCFVTLLECGKRGSNVLAAGFDIPGIFNNGSLSIRDNGNLGCNQRAGQQRHLLLACQCIRYRGNKRLVGSVEFYHRCASRFRRSWACPPRPMVRIVSRLRQRFTGVRPPERVYPMDCRSDCFHLCRHSHKPDRPHRNICRHRRFKQQYGLLLAGRCDKWRRKQCMGGRMELCNRCFSGTDGSPIAGEWLLYFSSRIRRLR